MGYLSTLRFQWDGFYRIGPIYLAWVNTSLHGQDQYNGVKMFSGHVYISNMVMGSRVGHQYLHMETGAGWVRGTHPGGGGGARQTFVHPGGTNRPTWSMTGPVQGQIVNRSDNSIDRGFQIYHGLYLWWTGTDGRYYFHKDEEIHMKAFYGSLNLSDPSDSQDNVGFGTYDSATVFEDYGGFGSGNTFTISGQVSRTRDRPNNAAKYPDHAPGAFGTAPILFAGDGLPWGNHLRPTFQLWDSSQNYQGVGTNQVELWDGRTFQYTAMFARPYDASSADNGEPVWKSGPAIQVSFEPVGNYIWVRPPINIPHPWTNPNAPNPPVPRPWQPHRPWPNNPNPRPDPWTCFLSGTHIAMSDDSVKPIEKIRIGDEVKICNTDINEVETSTVTKVFVHKNVTKYLTINGELNVTPEHPLYDGRVWRPAGDYEVNDTIQYIDNTYKNIESIENNFIKQNYNRKKFKNNRS